MLAMEDGAESFRGATVRSAGLPVSFGAEFLSDATDEMLAGALAPTGTEPCVSVAGRVLAG